MEKNPKTIIWKIGRHLERVGKERTIKTVTKRKSGEKKSNQLEKKMLRIEDNGQKP